METLFAERLRLLVSESGKFAKDIAADLGISQARLSNYQLGKSDPPSALLIKIANYFGVPIDFLLGVTHSTGKLAEPRSEDTISKSSMEQDVRLLRIINLFSRINNLDAEDSVKKEALEMFAGMADCLEQYLIFASDYAKGEYPLDAAMRSMDDLRDVEKIAMRRIAEMIRKLIKDDSADTALKDRVFTKTAFRIAPTKRIRSNPTKE